jgi:hypothetical protein
MTLAPAGTPFWKPQKDDFAPRLGLAWQSVSNLVFRAGGGIFYDLGYSGIANSGSAYPFSMTKLIFNTAFPLTGVNAAPPPFTIAPPYGFMSLMDPNHVLPRTYEWKAALEKTLGSADIFTLTYVGAAGCKLMRMDLYEAPNPNFSGGST